MSEMRLATSVYWSVACAGLLLGQEQEPLRLGNGISAPKLLKKTEPAYTHEAGAEHIEGMVLMGLVIGVDGKAREIEVLSPLGWGLDERAREAIEKWEFAPGRKDGHAVPVRATVEVLFRFQGSAFDRRREERRTAYNRAVRGMMANTRPSESTLAEMTRLAREKYPPAMATLGFWKIRGLGMTADTAAGLDLLQRAAKADSPQALFLLGTLYFSGELMPQDQARGVDLIKSAARLGRLDAQQFLGIHYATGEGVTQDAERSRYYFRLCAAGGVGPCQYRLAKAMSDTGSGAVQALAWMQLAADNRVAGAAAEVSAREAKLTAEDLAEAERLRPRLVRAR